VINAGFALMSMGDIFDHDEAVAELRRRKGRVGKPFALMMPETNASRLPFARTRKIDTEAAGSSGSVAMAYRVPG
jgi:hydrogenase maturation factor HypF (carbamoyltransferase family)